MKISDLIDEQVIHKVYGNGIIKSIEDSYLIASFANGKESNFSFPLCFDKFIKLADDNKQLELQQFVIKWKKENGIFKQEKLHKLTAITQEGIKTREIEREKRRQERAKEEAERNRMFLGS